MTGIIILNVFLCVGVVFAVVGLLGRAIGVARTDDPRAGRRLTRERRTIRHGRRAGATAIRPSA